MTQLVRLDRIDHAILAALQNDARISNKDLASQVGLAPSSCLERVRRLEANQVVTGSRALVDPHQLGIALQAMVAVRLIRHSRHAVDAFQQYALSLPEVLAVFHVAGANDFLIHVAARDAEHLRDLAMDAFTSRPEVAHLETNLIFSHDRNRVLPSYRDPRP